MYQVNNLFEAIRLSWLNEPLINCRASLNYLLGLLPTFKLYQLNPSLSATDISKNPSLLLHGNFHNQSAWLALAKSASGQTLGSLYTLNLHSGPYTVADRTLINNKINQIKLDYSARGRDDVKVNLIGHSRGAVMAFYMSLPADTWRINQAGQFVMQHAVTTWRDDIGMIIRLGHPTTVYEKNLLAPGMIKQVYDLVAKHDQFIPYGSALPVSQQYTWDCRHLSLLYLPSVHQQIFKLIQSVDAT